MTFVHTNQRTSTMTTTAEQTLKRREQLKAQDVIRNAAVSKIAGDVLYLFGERPKIESTDRREQSLESLRFYLTESGYFPHSTGRAPLCAEQERMIERIERVLLKGGRTAHGAFRGATKSTVLELAELWAILKGLRDFVGWYGATSPIAKAGVNSVMMELEENDRLAADFPDACHLFRAMEGNRHKAKTQKYDGVITHIQATTTELVIPFLNEDGTIDRWACFRSKGLNAEDAARALRWKSPNGESIRPDSAAIDDPQSDKSARSNTQIEQRLKLIETIAKSGSRDKSFAVCVAGNVIELGDVMDQLLDPVKYPSYTGERISQLKSWPDAKDTLWQQYATIRQHFNKVKPGDRDRAVAEANAFYLANQGAMDTGGEATWDHAYEHDNEYTSLQSAMNAWIDTSDEVFACECQQQPLSTKVDGLQVIQVPRFVFTDKRTNLERRVCPSGTEGITVGRDVQGSLLYWLAVAWDGDGSGSIIDYGAWPDQQVVSFTLRSPRVTLTKAYPTLDARSAIRRGLDDHKDWIMAQDWRDTAGHSVPIVRVLTDTGFEADHVYTACEQSGHPSVFVPCHGKGLGPLKKPLTEYRREPGMTIGDNWLFRRPKGRPVKAVEWDTNRWKVRLLQRLQLPKGRGGCLTIFGNDQYPHNMIEDHLMAESGHRKSGDGRTIYEFKLDVKGRDNHLLDCLAMALVAASHAGLDQPRGGQTALVDESSEDYLCLDSASQHGWTVSQ